MNLKKPFKQLYKKGCNLSAKGVFIRSIEYLKKNL